MKRILLALGALCMTLASVEAAPKNLSVQDIDFETIRSGDRDTVKANVKFQSDQYESVKRKGQKIEIRFYAGQNKGGIPRIMKKKSYYLASAKSSWTLSPKEACPTPGHYYAKIWLSVRHGDGGYDQGYKQYTSDIYSYVCYDDPERLDIDSEYSIKEDRWGDVEQVSVNLDMARGQYEDIKDEDLKLEVRLYAHRDSQYLRVKKNKTYILPSAKASYTYSPKEMCGQMRSLWDDIFGKPVRVSCRVTAVDSKGRLSPDYEAYYCPASRTFICPSN